MQLLMVYIITTKITTLPSIITLCILGNFYNFLSSADFFYISKLTSNSLAQDQVQTFVGPDLLPNLLLIRREQKLLPTGAV